MSTKLQSYKTTFDIDIIGYSLAYKIAEQISYEYKLTASSFTVGSTQSNDDWICQIHLVEKISKSLETELRGYIKGFINANRIYSVD